MNTALKSLFLTLTILMPVIASSAGTNLQSIMTADHRDTANQQRDVFRHPAETLTFFGVTADMQVAEIWPGKGWYTEILAPWIKQGDGQLIAAGFPADMGPGWRQNLRQNYNQWLADNPQQYDEVSVVEFGPGYWQIADANSLDAVLTFRNVHNWVKGEVADKAFDAMFEALKPGGILGVTDHRAKPDTDLATMKKTGYLTESLVIELAESAGFILQATAEINANGADTADHPNGVWTLPPTLRIDDAQKPQYQAVGESDRMTLKFIKPE